jgi:hypothetical protein
MGQHLRPSIVDVTDVRHLNWYISSVHAAPEFNAHFYYLQQAQRPSQAAEETPDATR